ncbi:MAG: polyhydroxyalkanoic acid system family protein [Sandaracinaceae bacterium]|nr:polyhydroxyalkanoic acid system family protein [Sandaracinaceae bacterium]
MGIKHEIHHGLSLELARKAIDKAMEAYGARFVDYDPRFDWKTEVLGQFSFRARGVGVEGEIEIIGPEIYVDVEVPFILRIFRGKAIDVIDREVRKWVEKARNGEI